MSDVKRVIDMVNIVHEENQFTGPPIHVKCVPRYTMLYNYKARVYDPMSGRFLQTHPVGYGSDVNWHAYVGNDPVNADPTGSICASTVECQSYSDSDPESIGGRSITIKGKTGRATAGALVIGPIIWNAGVHTFEFATGQSHDSTSNDKADSSDEAKSNSAASTKWQNAYYVRVPVQGIGIKQDSFTPIFSYAPVKLRDVHLGLTVLAAGLSPSEQKAMRPASIKAPQWAGQVAVAGGVGPIGSKSFDTGKLYTDVYKIDIEVLAV